jgi:hypothetical protein
MVARCEAAHTHKVVIAHTTPVRVSGGRAPNRSEPAILHPQIRGKSSRFVLSHRSMCKRYVARDTASRLCFGALRTANATRYDTSAPDGCCDCAVKKCEFPAGYVRTRQTEAMAFLRFGHGLSETENKPSRAPATYLHSTTYSLASTRYAHCSSRTER